ncbi:MAG: hypothetical protein AAGC81_16820 [Pseudomonadota bacterium]
MEFTVTAEDLFLLNTIAIWIGVAVGWAAMIWPWDRKLPSWNGTRAVARLTPLRSILGSLVILPIYLSLILHYLQSPYYPDLWAYLGAVSYMIVAMIAVFGIVIIGLATFGLVNRQTRTRYPNEIVWDAEGLSWTAPRKATGALPWSAVREIDRTRSINIVGKITFKDGCVISLSRGLVGAQQLLDRAEAATGIGNGQSGQEEQGTSALSPA